MLNESYAAESRMERKKAETRQKIQGAALELFASQGFHNTTMEQIASAADVARKTLYNYYPLKEAIADEYIRGVSLGLAAECREEIAGITDVRNRLLHALSKVYSWVANHPDIAEATILYRMKQDSKLKEETGTQSISAEILRQGQEDGAIKSELPVQMMANYLNILRGAVLFDWLQDPYGKPLQEKAAAMVDIFLYGVTTDAARPVDGSPGVRPDE